MGDCATEVGLNDQHRSSGPTALPGVTGVTGSTVSQGAMGVQRLMGMADNTGPSGGVSASGITGNNNGEVDVNGKLNWLVVTIS